MNTRTPVKTQGGSQRAACWSIVALVSLVHGCGMGAHDAGKPPVPAASAPQTPKSKIALILKSMESEFYKTIADGARKHQAVHSSEYELIVSGIPGERDAERQIALVKDMTTQHVSAIVIAPADPKALILPCKQAQQAGIVVINIDQRLDEQALKEQGIKVPFVAPDNRAGAKMVGTFLASRLKSGDKVAVLEGIKSAINSQQRKLGFEDAMKEAGMTVVDSQSARWEIDTANKIAAGMLGKHQDLTALLCCSDSMALGALAAVKETGRQHDVLIVGYDGIAAVNDAIKNDLILASADQHADQLAVFAIEFARLLLSGDVPPADKRTPVDLVNAESLGKADPLETLFP